MMTFETKLWIIVGGIILQFILLSNGAIIMNNRQMMRDRNGELVEAGSVNNNNLRTGLVGKLKKKPNQESYKKSDHGNHGNHANNGENMRTGYNFEPAIKNRNYHSYSNINDPDPTIVYLNSVPTPIPEIEYSSKPSRPTKPPKKPNYMSFLVTKENQNQYINTPPPAVIRHENLEPTKAYLTNDLVNPDYLNYLVKKEEKPNYYINPSPSPQFQGSSQTPPWIKPEFYQPQSNRPFASVSTTSSPINHYPSAPSTTSTPFFSTPYPTIVYNDDLTSKENFLNQTYDELIKYDQSPNSPHYDQNPIIQNLPINIPSIPHLQNPLISQNSQIIPNTQYLHKNEHSHVQTTLEQPNVVVIYASPTPDYMHYQQQTQQTAPQTTKKKTSKNKSKKNSTITQEHEFMQNLEFFKKYFTFNCSIMDSNGNTKEGSKTAVPQEKVGPYKITNKLPPTTVKPPKAKATKRPQTVAITPKPKLRNKDYPYYYKSRPQKKAQNKVVYVEQIPGVEEVENIFEGVYDLVENAFTSKEIVEMRNKHGSNITALDTLLHKKRQIKSPKSKSLDVDGGIYLTKNNKMDTTKEYDGYRMETIPVSPDPPRIPRADEEKKSSSESEEEQPDYYFNQFNLGFNNQADQEEYSEEETNEEYSDEESKEEGHDDAKLDISHDKVIDKNGQPPRKERLDDDSYEVYSDEESAEKPAGVMDKVKGIFSKGIFASLGSFFSGLTGSTRIPYEGDDDMTEEEYDEVTARATTPSGSEKVSKRPKRANPTRNPWAFFQDANFFETDAEKLESMPSVADMNIDALFLNPFDSLNWNFFGEREGTAPRKTKKPPSGKSIDYTDNQLWRLNVTTADQIAALEEFQIADESKGIQWWRGPNLKENNDVLVPPNKIAALVEFLDDEDMTYEILNRNIQNAVQYENHELTLVEREEMAKKNGHPFSWFKYHDFDEIQKYQEMLQRKFPQNVEVLHIGTSYEGRPLTLVKISANDEVSSSMKKKVRSPKKRKGKSVKSAIFIESGSEGRDWIGPAVSTWMLDAVTKGIHRNDTLGETMRSMDWYIMPILNPDGYDYSHKFDRFWKKTRSANNEQPLGLLATAWDWIRKSTDPKKKEAVREICYGVDPDKNFRDDEWAETGTADGCSDDYSGKFAFSEPETKALGKFLLKHRKQIRIFLSLKPYGQSISYSKKTSSKNQYDDLMDMAIVARETLKDVGMAEYTVKNMEQPPGSSNSFAMHQGIKYSFQLSLKDSATNGVVLPASHIEMTAKEAFEVVRGMIDYM